MALLLRRLTISQRRAPKGGMRGNFPSNHLESLLGGLQVRNAMHSTDSLCGRSAKRSHHTLWRSLRQDKACLSPTQTRTATLSFSTKGGGNQENPDDEEDETAWIPPSHSPLAAGGTRTKHTADEDWDVMPDELKDFLVKESNHGKTVEYLDLEHLTPELLAQLSEKMSGELSQEISASKVDDEPDGDDLDFGSDYANDSDSDDDELEEDEDLVRLELEMLAEEMEMEEKNMGEIDEMQQAYMDLQHLMGDDMTTTVIPNKMAAGQEPATPKTSKEINKPSSQAIPDWTMTRRSKLSQETTLRGVKMMKPKDGAAARARDAEIPIAVGTLLTANEIMSCLKGLGGKKVVLIESKSMAANAGASTEGGMIIATGKTYSHIRTMADAIVRNLKERKLAGMGVMGAMYGAEGGSGDPTISRRNRRKSGMISRSAMDDGWMVVDCYNYIVHVQNAVTRRHLNLESLWSNDPNSEGHKLRRVDVNDDDAVDAYVVANPIPEEYANQMHIQNDAFTSQAAASVFARKKRAERWSPPTTGKNKSRGRRYKR